MMTRTLAGAIWPALSYAIYQVEATLYQFEFLWTPLDLLHTGLVYPIFQDVRPVFTQAIPIFLLLALLVALNWWTERFWCRYLCPLGGLLGFVSKLALVRRQVGAVCEGCALCLPQCPTDTIDPRNGYSSDPAECTVCYDCLVGCPQNGIAFRPPAKWRPAAWHKYDPRRREALAALGAAVVGASLAGGRTNNQTPGPHLAPSTRRDANRFRKSLYSLRCLCPRLPHPGFATQSF